MRHYPLLLFLSIIPVLGYSQNSNGKSIFVKSNLTETVDGFMLTPGISFDNKQHEFDIGPILLLSFSNDFESRESFKLSGVFGQYSRVVGQASEKLSVSILANLFLHRIKDERESQFFDTASQTFQSTQFKSVDLIIQAYLGYGIRWEFNDQFFFNQSLGIGGNFTSRTNESAFGDFSDTFLDQDWLFQAGIGYQF